MVLTLGPYRLLRPVGRGAMALVWRGVHQAQATPVAVKVMTADVADPAGFRARFAEEVRAVARLDHPGVVRLHDHGELPAGLAEAMGQAAAVPYLVMEWVGGGTLSSRRGQMGWPAVRATLASLLEALAHAHARGIVHRDLKPANVLLADRGPVLSDFGVAFAADAEAQTIDHIQVGTPNYMAPEQIRGDWRSLGPWTDVYALGCLAWTLVTGRAPFGGQPVVAIMQSHLHRPLPDFRPVVAVPVGLEGWLRQACAKDPGERFALAADAAVALLALPEKADRPAVGGGVPLAEDDATVVAPPVFVAVGDPAWGRGPGADGRPPMPVSWAGPARAVGPGPLLGVGRSLFALRVAPLAGRVAERDVLWGALRAVVEGEGPRAVVVEGGAGFGKSRLVEWLAERAHTLGVALPLRVEHQRFPGPECGVAAAVSRWLRLERLSGSARWARVAAVLGSGDRELVAAVAAAADRGGSFETAALTVRLGSPGERVAAVARAVALLAGQRPRVLWVDDAQWGAEAVGLVERVLDDPGRPAVLAVVVVRDDALRAGSVEAEAVARLRARAARVVVGALDREAFARMVQSRLPLDRAVVDRLAERTGGSPLFGEELLRDWIQAGALVSTAGGFRPRSGAEDALPEGIEAVWWARLRRVVAGLAPRCDEALEVAAALGEVFEGAVWGAVCGRLGFVLPGSLGERLLDERLLRVEGAYLAFAHAMIRETLAARSRRAGRWGELNAACADELAARGEPDAWRRGRHLLAAGRAAEAVPLLLMAADGALGRSEYLAARRVLLAAARALRAAGASGGDPAWSGVEVRWSRMTRVEGRMGDALRHARRAERRARAAGVRPLVVQALMGQGSALVEGGRMAEAWGPLERAVAEAAGGEPGLRSMALCRAGNCLIWLGRAEEAAALLGAALAVGEDPWPHADARLSLAELWRRRGRLDAAAREGEAAAAMYRAAGSRWGMAQAEMILGDVDRARGRVAVARGRYAEARRLCVAIGSGAGVGLCGLRDALALLDLDRFAEARAALEALAGLDGRSAVVVAACLLPCHAAAGDWRRYDACRAALGGVATGAVSEPDVARAVARAAALCGVAGEGARAADAAALAAVQAAALGWGEVAGEGASGMVAAGMAVAGEAASEGTVGEAAGEEA
ncbi:MAG: protein kinase [Myxococcales bacterium]|nr:protein kinase [Myxococcales bacterium]